MMPSIGVLFGQAWASITQPRNVAKWVMSFELPRTSRWEALLLVVVLSALFAQLTVLVIVQPQAVAFARILMNPWMTGIIQMSVLVIAVFSIYWIGRAMGGTGDFGNAIILVAWLQFCMICLQLAQTVFMFVFPPVASLIGLGGVVLFFWLLTNFIAELHGFRSLPHVFVMIIISLVGLVIGLSILLSIIGVSMPGAAGYV